MLRGVVTDGSGRGLLDVPGPPVIAKTGTAEFGTGADLQTHAWMIAAQGDLAVCVFVDVGESGSRHGRPDPRGVPARRAAVGPRRTTGPEKESGPPVAWGQRGALADFAVLPPKSTLTEKHNPAPAVMSSVASEKVADMSGLDFLPTDQRRLFIGGPWTRRRGRRRLRRPRPRGRVGALPGGRRHGGRRRSAPWRPRWRRRTTGRARNPRDRGEILRRAFELVAVAQRRLRRS